MVTASRVDATTTQVSANGAANAAANESLPDPSGRLSVQLEGLQAMVKMLMERVIDVEKVVASVVQLQDLSIQKMQAWKDTLDSNHLLDLQQRVSELEKAPRSGPTNSRIVPKLNFGPAFTVAEQSKSDTGPVVDALELSFKLQAGRTAGSPPGDDTDSSHQSPETQYDHNRRVWAKGESEHADANDVSTTFCNSCATASEDVASQEVEDVLGPLTMLRQSHGDHAVAWSADPLLTASSFHLTASPTSALDSVPILSAAPTESRNDGMNAERFSFRLDPFRAIEADEISQVLQWLWRSSLTDNSEASLDVNACDADGRTILHVAAAKGLLSICVVLLDCDAFTEANARDYRQRTALHLAAAQGHLEVCKTLLDHRGFQEESAIDSSGHTALHLATANGHHATYLLLRHRQPRNPAVSSDLLRAENSAMLPMNFCGYLPASDSGSGIARALDVDESARPPPQKALQPGSIQPTPRQHSPRLPSSVALGSQSEARTPPALQLGLDELTPRGHSPRFPSGVALGTQSEARAPPALQPGLDELTPRGHSPRLPSGGRSYAVMHAQKMSNWSGVK